MTRWSRLTPDTSNVTVEGIISYDTRRVFEIVNCVFLSNIVSVFGVVANIINLIIFSKQGFNSSMNISFFSLGISDLCSLIALLWFNICVNPLFVQTGLSMDPSEIQHLTSCSPHNCFSRITGFITVFMTFERCLCIMMPLKVKQIITPRRTILVICCIYFLMMMSYVPEFTTVYIGWKYYPKKNVTLLGLKYTSNRATIEGLAFILYASLGTLSFFAVIVLTALLVYNLRQKAKWRQETIDSRQSESISNRDKKTMNMVILIATVLIVCYIPGTLIGTAMFIWPEFTIIGRYVNIFMVTWSFAFLFEAFNASVNIFMYYKLSSKYRHTFHKVFPCCFSGKDMSGETTYTDTTAIVSERSNM